MSRSRRFDLPGLLLIFAITLYTLYFSLFSIRRYQKLYAHYFDLGIMHQTVYNTYKGLQTGDLTRILEITNPHEGENQMKRMGIHNDILLAALAPLYFIHDGPETLLLVQTIVLAFGAYFLYQIALVIFKKEQHASWIALAFAVSYLLYPPMQKANNFDFHAITLATTGVLAMYYFWLQKKYALCSLCAILVVLSKEEAGLIVASFGVYILYYQGMFTRHLPHSHFFTAAHLKNILHRFALRIHKDPDAHFGVALAAGGLVWTLFSMLIIIPLFRGEAHFATGYYSYLWQAPWKIVPVIFRYETFHYIFILLAPVGLLSLLSPAHLLIALPELAINILSGNGAMRNIYFHYDSLITPVLFIAAMYGAKRVRFFIVYLLLCTVVFSLYLSPLPWGHHRDIYPWQALPAKHTDVLLWQKLLDDDSIAVSATGHLGPHFTSRRYFYNFAGGYSNAAYVVIDRSEMAGGFQAEDIQKQYDMIQKDWQYIKIYDQHDIEVYKKF